MLFLIRSFVFNFFALHLAASFLPGVMISGGLKSLALASLALAAFNFLVKPILRLLFLPINLLTLGLFRWVINVVILYLLILSVPAIEIVGFNFSGLSWQNLNLPAMAINTFLSIIFTSFFLSFILSLFDWLRK